MFEKSWQDNFPLLVHLLDFSLDKKAQIARIYSDEFFVEKTLQEQFYNFGVDIKNYVLEEPLRAFFDYERDRNCLVVCRVNFLDQIEVLDRLKLIETLPTIKERIKLAKHKNVQEDLTEAHLTKQYKEELQGNYDYVRPKNFK